MVKGDPSQGDYVLGLLPLSGAVVGLAAASRRVANLFVMVGLSIGLYAVFVLLYWHFEGRYFQVAVGLIEIADQAQPVRAQCD